MHLFAHSHRQTSTGCLVSHGSSSVACYSGRSSLRTCQHLGPQRRSRAVSVRAAAAPADLRQLLEQKERELASLFDSGRPMPQASVVAALRAEIAALDAQLTGRALPAAMLPSAPRAPSGSSSVGPPQDFAGYMPRPPSGSPAAGGPPSSPSVRSRTEQLADRAYEMVEQQMRANQGMGQEDDADIARLEHENTQLRAEAYALLQRQQQLEAMLAEARGQKEPELLLESAESLLARMKAKLQKS